MTDRAVNFSLNMRLGRSSRILLLVALILVGYAIGSVLNAVLPSTVAAETNGAPKSAGAAIVEPPRQLHDFTLTSQTGAPISLSSLRGKAVLLFFGYTHCPEECPTTMANFERIKQTLGDRADQVAFVFISVDGERDTPAQLTQFLDQFDPDFIGMTGSEATLRQIGAEYGLLFAQNSITAPAASDDQTGADHQALDQQNYFVQHTSPSFLVDRNGYLRMVFFYGTEPDAIATRIRQILPS